MSPYCRDPLPLAVVIAAGPVWEKARLRLRRTSMSDQRGFVTADQFHPHPYAQSWTAERALNAAIVHAILLGHWSWSASLENLRCDQARLPEME